MWIYVGSMSDLCHSYGYPHVWMLCGYLLTMRVEPTVADVYKSALNVDAPGVRDLLPQTPTSEIHVIHNDSPGDRWPIPHAKAHRPHFPHYLRR